MSFPRKTRIALAWTGAVLVAVPALTAAVLSSYDWNRARPWLNQKISAAIDRPFAIRGDVALSWRQQGSGGKDRTWRDYLPLPNLVASDVHVGNPRGMQAPAEMASVGRFAFAIELLPLLRHRIVIPVLRFDQPAVLLQRDADGRNNWTFHREDKPSDWTLDVRRVVFARGALRYIDALTRVDASAAIDTIDDPVYGIGWTLAGRWNTQAVRGSGKAGAVLGLQEQLTPYPLAASLNVGGTSIAVEGTLTKPAALAALDLRLKLSGPSMARLYGLTGVLLPETPPFATEGRLRGELGATASRWRYDQFTGRVGHSDIGGQLQFQTGAPRPVLSGAVQSQLLQMSDLGPLIGADSQASKAARGAEVAQPGNKVLPVESFRTERWTAIDADVSFRAGQITRRQALPIQHLDTRIHLKDGVLALQPLDFDIAGGRFHAGITLDGSGKVNPGAIVADLKAGLRGLQLKQLFPIEGMQATVGEVNADMVLRASGNSVASLLGASNGEFKGSIEQGSISKLLLEEMGLNIGSVLLTRLAGDQQVKLNCMVADLPITKGLMQSRLFVADTADARIAVSGNIDLDKEKLDLTLQPDAKSMRVLSLRAPIYVRGSFKQPDLSLDKGRMALRAGSALALAVVAPVAAIVPLVSTAPGDTADCRALLAQMRTRPLP